MLVFGRPAFLLAGALLALVPLLLHLIAPRPPARAPLPTARFLTPEPRMRLRIERLPTDVPLMLLRMLFVFTLLAAFAEPRLEPRRAGTADIVLLDAGMPASLMAQAGDSARALADRAERATVLVFDSAARIAPDGLAGPATTASYDVALRALRDAALASSADSVRAWLITTPRWQAWPPGFAASRPVLWPGGIGVIALTPTDDSTAAARAAPGRAGWRGVILSNRAAAGNAGGPAERIAASPSGLLLALEAIGIETTSATPDSATAALQADPAVIVTADGVVLDAGTQDLLVRAASGGGRVLIGGSAQLSDGPLATLLPWRAGGSVPEPSRLYTEDLEITAVPAGPGAPAAGSRVPAVWWGGQAAAAAIAVGEGCLVYAAFALEATEEALDPAFPDLLAALLRACEEDTPLSLPLDRGALSLLAGAPSGATDRAAEAIAVATLSDGRADRSIARWLILAALLLALIETVLARRGRRPGPVHPAPRTNEG
jgi:hypothetical protein